MNTEIKFRAWDLKNLKWVNKTNITAFHLVGEHTMFDMLNQYSIDNLCDLSIMQFTGLKDKNGKEIYADDLLKDDRGLIFRVYHTQGGFAIKESVWAKDLEDEVNTDILIFQPLADAQTISYIKGSCEVVGNIYENSK